jgi:hypothetical protein
MKAHPQVFGEGCEDLCVTKRLSDKNIATGSHDLISLLFQGMGREGSDLGRGAGCAGFDASCRRKPFHDRHADVHPDSVGMPLFEEGYRLLPIDRLAQFLFGPLAFGCFHSQGGIGLGQFGRALCYLPLQMVVCLPQFLFHPLAIGDVENHGLLGN